MTERTSEPVFIPCDCATAYHLLKIEADADMPEMLNIAFVSTRNGYFWHRVKWAMKHVFGRDDLVFADIIVSRDKLATAIRGDTNG